MKGQCAGGHAYTLAEFAGREANRSRRRQLTDGGKARGVRKRAQLFREDFFVMPFHGSMLGYLSISCNIEMLSLTEVVPDKS